MITELQRIDIPDYADLVSATANFADMGEHTISATVKVDGQIAPRFSSPWLLAHNGHKYIMPLRQPQAAKENTSLQSTLELTFQHWAEYRLKQKFFFDVSSADASVAVPDKYIASVGLNLSNFCKLFSKVLKYYFGDEITLHLDETAEKLADPDPIYVEINYSYLWDVLIQFHDLWGVRWQIEPDGSPDKYVIKIGEAPAEVTRPLKYGFDGGLLKVERQVQNPDIRNILLGRGGSKNIPANYFKKGSDPQFPDDPDWIPELANVYFSELRGATFRSYVQGWKAQRYGGTTRATDAYSPSAWQKGNTDATFDPIEDVRDQESINKYGELWGALENNEDIYPSIQNRSSDALGRLDQVVAVEPITSDDYLAASENQAELINVQRAQWSAVTIGAGSTRTLRLAGGSFTVPEGKTALFVLDPPTIKAYSVPRGGASGRVPVAKPDHDKFLIPKSDEAILLIDGKRQSADIAAGTHSWEVRLDIENTSSVSLNAKGNYENPHILVSDPADQWGTTWCIWIKNVFDSPAKPAAQSPEAYASEVWDKILGDHLGNEAKVIFSSGNLATSEDYEFLITRRPEYDTSKSLNGVPSHWKLTLAKNDADLDATGKWLPSTMRQAHAGDSFFFAGIELPHAYVTRAEEDADNYKLAELQKVKDIIPTWVVSLDKVRLIQSGNDPVPLIEQLIPGATVRLHDPRFILNELGEAAAYETLRISSVSIQWNEPTDGSPALIPDVEIVLAGDYEVSASPVATMQGQIDTLSRRLGSIGNIEALIRAVGDKLYLRKDGLPDISVSPTEFYSLLTSGGFRSGMVGGVGWGFFRDANGRWVLEVDKLNVRQEMQVNTLVINQIEARGGMIIESAAAIEVSSVTVDSDGNFYCYFDNKTTTVANLFKLGDVALCHRVLPDAISSDPSKALKYYRRRVIGTGNNYIRLSATVADGSGEPEPGDVIVHFGSYLHESRRFVKVRDVLGGGYERYIEGLDSVTAEGTEYYFVGRQSGMYNNRPRFYIGDDEGYIEWKDGKLTVKGDLQVQSTIGGKTFVELIKGEVENRVNCALKTPVPKTVALTESDSTTGLYFYEGLDQNQKFTLSFDYEFSDLTVKSGAIVEVLIFKEGGQSRYGTLTLKEGKGHFSTTNWMPASGNNPASRDIIRIRHLNLTGALKISRLMLQHGPDETPWQPNPSDTDYLLNALTETTTISGGLILSSVVQVGDSSSGTYTVRAGMSGLDSSSNPVAFWAGGTYSQAMSRTANYAVYMDGTGYMAKNTLRFLDSLIEVGDYLSLDKAGLAMTINGKKRLLVGNYPIDGRLVINAVSTHKLNYTDFEWKVPQERSKYYHWTNSGKHYINIWLDTYYINQNKTSVSCGSVPAGATIKILGGFSFVSPYAVNGLIAQNVPALWLIARDGEKELDRMRINGKYDNSSQNILYDLSNFSYVPGADIKNLSFKFYFANTATADSNYSEFDFQPVIASNTLSSQVTIPSSEQTAILGVDGTQFSWGNSHQYQQQDFWGIRVGNYGIKITPSGIFVMLDGETHISLAEYIKRIK